MYQRLSGLDSERVFAGVARSGATKSLRTGHCAGPAVAETVLRIVVTDIDHLGIGSPKSIRNMGIHRLSLSRRVREQIAGSPLAVPAEGSR